MISVVKDLNLELLRTGPGSGKGARELELKDSRIQVQCLALLPPVVKCTLLVLNFVGIFCINKHKLLSAFGIFCCEMMLVCKDFTHCLFQFILLS